MQISDFKKGDLVTYIPIYGDRENGVVASINRSCVFVKYDNAVMKMITGDEPYTAQGTRPEDLIRR